jgi:hypothetical protein
MARTLTPLDCYSIINSIQQQMCGETSLTATDPSSFIAVGENVLQSGTENTLNALSLQILKTLIAIRPYNAKYGLINRMDGGAYANRLRKITFLSDPALPAGDWNTQLFTNLAEDFDNGTNPAGTPPAAQSTASMWEQHPPVPIEFQFSGSSVWQDCITRYEYQVKQAFASEEQFANFVAGFMTEKGNEIESQKEAFARMTVLNFMAGLYDMSRAVNLTSLFNTTYNITPAYTTQELLTTHLDDFLKFFVATIQKYSDMYTHRTSMFHWNPTRLDNKVILRHTLKDKQKLFIYNPMMIDARATVMPGIFNPQYLDIKNYEGIDYWQAADSPMAISITPSILDSAGAIDTGTAVAEDNIVALLFDEDALAVQYQIDNVATTPMEARKHYINTWYSFARNAINDFSENATLFYMAD